jgi:type I restriction enzyme M protein
MASKDTAEKALADENVIEAIKRGFIEVKNGDVIYNLASKKIYDWSDPEEWVRARLIAFLVIDRGYPASRLRTEVAVPRRTPSDFADIVVYKDDRCREPYLVVEVKSSSQSVKARRQWIEQAFGNANSLRAPLTLYDEWTESIFFDVAGYPSTEREEKRRGSRDAVPAQYGEIPFFRFTAGGEEDISPARAAEIIAKIRRAHSIIWSGGKRDPLTSFDEWSKLLFAKVIDERTTPTGQPREFQVAANETSASVANRIHALFSRACREDPTIFPDGIRINLPDKKIVEIVRTLQPISFVATDVDHIGVAFESFFGSVFRGELGQYFTMRQLARFTVAMLDINHNHFVLDPTAGSGGFLLEVLLQVWHRIDAAFHGQSLSHIDRIKTDFALAKVYGIEIHETLARICKINLLLHHDGHTNIEAGRSCLDIVFTKPRLTPERGRFHRVVGNPPFGDEVPEGDEDHLGENSLANFELAEGRSAVASEHVILERSIAFLEPGGRLGLVVPDGVLNNQGEKSNCPRVRRFVATHGFIEAIVSLPDYAFRKSGAQNKTSILFFRKFTRSEQSKFMSAYRTAKAQKVPDPISAAWEEFEHRVFLGEANFVGYTATGSLSAQNDLYNSEAGGVLAIDQSSTILGEYRTFLCDPNVYQGINSPDCMAISFRELWLAHTSHRLDPKYFLFKRQEQTTIPAGWVRLPLRDVMQRREDEAHPENAPDQPVTVMTIGQSGEIRARQAGKGKSPPEWLGTYFEDSPSQWFAAKGNDVVFSSIDLWKGCISVVPNEFDGALVTKEFPIYAVVDERLDPEFISCLLRSRYYQRAFREITAGHSNRRRTQREDFEELEICFPPDPNEQIRLIADIQRARENQRSQSQLLRVAFFNFNNVIDGRGAEELPEIDTSTSDDE